MYSFIRQSKDDDLERTTSETDPKTGGDTYKAHKCKSLATHVGSRPDEDT